MTRWALDHEPGAEEVTPIYVHQARARVWAAVFIAIALLLVWAL